jgi:hypothetical protein
VIIPKVWLNQALRGPASHPGRYFTVLTSRAKSMRRTGWSPRTSRLHITGVCVLTTPSTCSHAKRAPRAHATELSKDAVFAGLQAVSRVGLRFAIASGLKPHPAVSSTVLRKERRAVAQTRRRRNLRGGSSDIFFERARITSPSRTNVCAYHIAFKAPCSLPAAVVAGGESIAGSPGSRTRAQSVVARV